LLSRLRYNPGPADGRMGQRTVTAVREFQSAAGVPEEGRGSSDLLDLLRPVAPPS
jgi:peptidoglycan hydrolase-like protein with peptidoglycan-binding domain